MRQSVKDEKKANQIKATFRLEDDGDGLSLSLSLSLSRWRVFPSIVWLQVGRKQHSSDSDSLHCQQTLTPNPIATLGLGKRKK